ncbi:WHG domain-containing protein [Streptomyces sp. NPDC051985]|uniref:TetR/AcrR family transcriptional regulator n=1 Tax=Streptomyces sp. NPDC051985 TaxID=3155807 RepID=UPI003423ACF4
MTTSSARAGIRPTPEETVRRLVEAATRLLAAEGPSAIKARSVADAAQVSTAAVYYHLGGLPELLQAVIDQAFRDLDEDFGTVAAEGDPVAELFTMALAAHRLAQGNPHLYDLMFGLSTRGSYRPPKSRSASLGAGSEAFRDAYAHLVQACVRLLDSERVRAGAEPEIIASQLWSCVHGFITLDLGGQFSQFEDPVRQVLGPVTTSVLIALGADPEQAAESYAVALAAYECKHSDTAA